VDERTYRVESRCPRATQDASLPPRRRLPRAAILRRPGFAVRTFPYQPDQASGLRPPTGRRRRLRDSRSGSSGRRPARRDIGDGALHPRGIGQGGTGACRARAITGGAGGGPHGPGAGKRGRGVTGREAPSCAPSRRRPPAPGNLPVARRRVGGAGASPYHRSRTPSPRVHDAGTPPGISQSSISVRARQARARSSATCSDGRCSRRSGSSWKSFGGSFVVPRSPARSRGTTDAILSVEVNPMPVAWVDGHLPGDSVKR
jgi:hypothetical protein